MLTDCSVLERQDLPCTYLAHHEPESGNIIFIIIIIIIIVIIIIIIKCSQPWLLAIAGAL